MPYLKPDLELEPDLAEFVFTCDVVDPDTGERLTFVPEWRQAIGNALTTLIATIRSARVEPLPRNPAEVRPLRAVHGTRSETESR